MITPPTLAELEAFRRKIVASNAFLLGSIERLEARGFGRRHAFHRQVRNAQTAIDNLASYLNSAELIDRFHTPGVDRLLREDAPEPRAVVWPDQSGTPSTSVQRP